MKYEVELLVTRNVALSIDADSVEDAEDIAEDVEFYLNTKYGDEILYDEMYVTKIINIKEEIEEEGECR
jgi:hypothetical protein